MKLPKLQKRTMPSVGIEPMTLEPQGGRVVNSIQFYFGLLEIFYLQSF